MSANTPSRFDYLNQLPRKIREMIFGYMVQNTLASHKQQSESSEHKTFGDPPNGFPLLGFEAFAMRTHLLTSPWVIHNKQYCVEYVKVLLQEVEIYTEIPDSGVDRSLGDMSSTCKSNVIWDILQLINSRFVIAARHTGIKEAKESLFPLSKGVCVAYHYDGTFFERGFGKREHRRFPPEDCLVKPVEDLRRYHEEFNIPSDRLSIEIWYGDPSWSILACLQTLDNLKHSVSLLPLKAKIFVDDYTASVAIMDSELDALRTRPKRIMEKMCNFYHPELDDLAHILELETMVEGDMVWLREKHVRIITEVTNFWKTQEGWYDWDDIIMSVVAENPHHQPQESATTPGAHQQANQTPMVPALSTTNSFQNLPRELRDLIFEYVVQQTPDSEFLDQPQRNNKNYTVLKCHSLNASCLALNKQSCTEYLTVLLRSLDSGIGAQDTETLDDCLHIINLLYKTAGGIGQDTEHWSHHIKSICLHQTTHSCYRKRNSTIAQTRIAQITPAYITEIQDESLPLSEFKRPVMPQSVLKHLYHLQTTYHIPFTKTSIILDHGNPTLVVPKLFDVSFSSEEDRCLGFYCNTLAHTVQASIHVTDTITSIPPSIAS